VLTLSAVVPEPTPACREALARLADAAIPQLDPIAAEMAQAIHGAVEVLTDDLLDETQASAKANIGLVLGLLRDGVDPAGVQPPPEALHYAREFVHRGMAVETLLGVYRVGHGAFWQIWLERMRDGIDDREVLAEAIAYCSAWTFGYVDAVSGPLATAFVAEKERWARSAVAQRVEEIKAVLGGRQIDEQRTSQRLRYELGRRHVGYVVWVDEAGDGDEAVTVLEQLATAAGKALGCASPLVAPAGRSIVSGWASLATEEVDPMSATKGLGTALAKARARIAFGEPGLGVDGFRRSHEEALTARRVALLGQRAIGARVRFDDIALTALLTSELGEARRFAERELGPLAEDTDAMRRLVATLRVFLEEGSSFVRAARRLSVHENTVAYRVKRAADLLGHPVDEGALRLHVALLLCEVLRRADEE
jgi:hypothetical protein